MMIRFSRYALVVVALMVIGTVVGHVMPMP